MKANPEITKFVANNGQIVTFASTLKASAKVYEGLKIRINALAKRLSTLDTDLASDMTTLLDGFSTLVEITHIKNLSRPNLESLLAEVVDIREAELTSMYQHFDKSLGAYFQVLSLDTDENGA